MGDLNRIVFDLRDDEPSLIYSDLPDDVVVYMFLPGGKLLVQRHIEDIGNLPPTLDMAVRMTEETH